MRVIFFLTSLFLIAIHPLRAQQVPDSVRDNVWTLRECVEYAIANNLTVKRSTYAVQSGLIDFTQAKMAMLPTVNANAGYDIRYGRNIDQNNAVVEYQTNQLNMNASGSLLLWNGFRLFYRYKETDKELDALNEDLIKARNDVILNVISIYLTRIFNDELYSNAQAQLNSTQQELDRTRRLAEAGSVPRSDVLNLEAQLATNELNLVERENAVNLARLQLKQALQLPASVRMEIEVPELDIDEDFVLDQTPEEIFDIAILQMPEMKSARLRQQSTQHALRSARGNFYPRLSLQGSIGTLYQTSPEVPNELSFNRQLNNNLGKSFGFNLQIPIFNGFNARSTVQRAFVTRELADVSYRETANALRQSIETAFNDASAATKTHAASQKKVQALTESFRMIEARREVGAANYVEYQIAENDLFQAESDLLRAKYDLIFKMKILDFYQGKTIDF